MLTWVTKLELRGIIIEGVNDAYVSLLKTLGAMSQLVSLRLSISISVSINRVWKKATQVLGEMNSWSSLVCLQELSIVCMCRSELLQYLQRCAAKLQTTLQAHLVDAQVQVTTQQYSQI